MSWDRIIRFEGVDGKTAFGEPIITAEDGFSIQELAEKGQLKAKCFEGADIFSLQKTDKVVEVKSLLPSLTEDDVPIVKCVGLNYMKHSKSLTTATSLSHPLTCAFISSPRRRPQTTPIPINLHQAPRLCGLLQRGHPHTQTRPRRPTRLRRRVGALLSARPVKTSPKKMPSPTSPVSCPPTTSQPANGNATPPLQEMCLNGVFPRDLKSSLPWGR